MYSSRSFSLFVSSLVGLLALSCASSSSAVRSSDPSQDPPIRVTLIDYAQGQEFELVNPAHTDPVEYYSAMRNEASRKIVATEVMEALVEFLEDQGFNDYGQVGKVPPVGNLSTVIEVEGPGGRAWWGIGRQTSAKERKRMRDSALNFLALYNEVTSYQRIENEQGSGYFQKSPSP